jgi:hypothetical protein
MSVVLGDRVGEQLAAHRLGALAGVGLALRLERRSVDQPADVHLADAFEAERVERAADRLALRVEDARARHHADLDLIFASR